MSKGLGRHVLGRMVVPMEGHGGDFFLFLPFYFVILFLTFFPWTLFLPGAISALVGNRLGGETIRASLLGWIIPTFVLMSLVITKLPHYILPIWPALALLTAGFIQYTERNSLNPRDQRWLKRGKWLFLPVGLGVSLFLMVGPWFAPIAGARAAILGGGLLFLAMTLLTVRLFSAGRYRLAAWLLCAGMMLFELHAAQFVLPALEPFKLSPALARQVQSRTPENVPVFSYEYEEPSLYFYMGKRKVTLLGGDAAVVAWAQESSPGVLIIPQKTLTRIEQQSTPLKLNPIGRAEGFNPGKGKWLELLVLTR